MKTTETATLDFLSKLIKGSKFEGKVYVAGGYVRDEILGLSPKDIDLVVELSNGGIEFANWVTKKLGIHKVGSNPVVFERFGTAKFQLYNVIYEGHDLSNLEIEVVMTRKEKYSDDQGRKPDVTPGTLKDDVERRDFTVNSLLKDISTGEIVDLTGQGISDINSGVIQTPMDPDVIFDEDPLRMLRAIRFAVKYNWKLPMFMIRSIKKNAKKLEKISMERIQVEFNKMLISDNPDKAVRLLQITGLNDHIAPELNVLVGIEQGKFHIKDVMGHTLMVVKSVPNRLETRLAGLFHDVGKGETKSIIDGGIHFYGHETRSAELVRTIMSRLKYPNETIDHVGTIVGNHMRTKKSGDDFDMTDKALRKLSRALGDYLEDTLDVIDADNKAHHPDHAMVNQVDNIRKRLKSLSVVEKKSPNLPINGTDVMNELGIIKGGPIVGSLLNIVQDAWDENPNITREEAIKLIKLKHWS